MPKDILNVGSHPVDGDALEMALQDLFDALNGSTGIFFSGGANEWCVTVGRTDEAHIDEIQ